MLIFKYSTGLNLSHKQDIKAPAYFRHLNILVSFEFTYLNTQLDNFHEICAYKGFKKLKCH